MSIDDISELDQFKSEAELAEEAAEAKPSEDNVEEGTDEAEKEGHDEGEDDKLPPADDSKEDDVKEGEDKVVAESPWHNAEKDLADLPKGVAKRLGKLTARSKQAEAKNRQTSAELADVKAKLAALLEEKNKGFAAPKKEDFESEDEYISYLVEQKLQDTQAKAKESSEKDAEAIEKSRELRAAWYADTLNSSKDLPDYDQVVGNSEAQLPRATMTHLMASGVGSYVFYHIGKDEDLQAEINSMEPAARHAKALELEQSVRTWLEARDKPKAPPAAAQKAEEGILAAKKGSPTPLKGKSTVKNLDPATADIMDWIEAHND